MDNIFSIITVSWVNFLLTLSLIFYTHLVVRDFKSIYVGIPVLIWLFQAALFYVVYFGYYYGIVIIPEDIAEKLYTFWATLSRTLLLGTFLMYLYYIQHSCRRGNGNL
jgi:hypothetical protein